MYVQKKFDRRFVMNIAVMPGGILEFNAKIEPRKRESKGASLIDFPEDYCIIDIETTGLSPFWDDIIEVSAVKVRGSEESEKVFSSLVQPTPNADGSYVDSFIEELTGITNEMLESAPKKEQILPKLAEFVKGEVIVGHNVNFDVNFLYDAFEEVGLPHFDNDFIDTMRLARRIRKDLDHHRLGDLAEAYGIDYEGAHRSLQDCKITYRVFSALKKDAEAQYGSLEQARKMLMPYSSRGVKATDILATVSPEDIDQSNPLYGKEIVFTGALQQFVRRDAMLMVKNMGGINKDNVTKTTNFLVLGNNDYCSSIKDGKSSKHKKAEKLKLDGYDIEIIPETVFYEMIGLE